VRAPVAALLRAACRVHTLGAVQYLDALPGRWLVWHGHGLLGPVRYACAEHRGDLTAFLRENYGTIAPHPWKRPPYPTHVRTAGTDRALRRKAQGGQGFF